MVDSREAGVQEDLKSQLFMSDSGIHGKGVYTRDFIQQGRLVIHCRGIERHKDEIVEGMRAMQIGPETYLAEDPDHPGLDDFINHSCNPNVGFLDGSLRFFALKDIQPGEELFWDYSTTMNEEGWEIPCGCGAPNCRGKIQSFCDLASEHKDRLRGIVLGYLR